MDKNEKMRKIILKAWGSATYSQSSDRMESEINAFEAGYRAALASQPVSADAANNQGELISVEDRLPDVTIDRHSWKESERVVVFVNYEHGAPYAAFAVLDNFRRWMIDGHNGNWTEYVTHWMPLPTPPIAARADQEKASKAGDHE